MPEEDYLWLPREDILHFEEIDRLVDHFLYLGVGKVRLTGGEPLLRRDLPELIERLARKSAIRDLAMTRTRLRKLQLPAALPAIFTGFRISAGLSVIGAVVGELFFKRGNKGIGILMDTYRSRNNYPLTYGALVLTALLGIAVFVFFGWLSHLVIGRWHESTRTTG